MARQLDTHSCSTEEHDEPAATLAGPVRHVPRAREPLDDEESNTSGLASVLVFFIVLGSIVAFRKPLSGYLDSPDVQLWGTIFVSLVVQAIPFLALGVVVSAAIAVFVPPHFFHKVLPKRQALAVPVAGLAGVALPGCECGSVPIAGGLVRRGVAPGVAFTFLLAAPALNPVVLAATAVAFSGTPEMVVARAVASALAAMAMGWLWLGWGRPEWIKMPARANVDGAPKWLAFFATMRHDFISAGGFLVVGAVAAAFLKVVVPAQWLNVLADNPLLAVLAMAVLAVILSLCSEADAFVAASLSQFSLSSRLVFLVVGPMIDLKLFAMQVGTFGRSFAFRFGPATFVVAMAVSAAVGWVLL
ncbi:MAG: permease [Corynebacteriales bacterium]|nr:permease [Mycobacteriales bacterium]